jgi:2-keto-4-pentenoate hydratase
VSDADRAVRAAEYLAALRRGDARPRVLPAALAPRNEAEAYEVQRELARALKEAIGGWKVAVDAHQQGTYAPIFAADIHPTPARVSGGGTAPLGIEPEVAFRLGRALPQLSTSAHYSREQVIDAVEVAHAAIEILASRFEIPGGPSPLEHLADNMSNVGLALSAPCAHWRSLDLCTIPLRLEIGAAGGTAGAQEARGGHALGDPLIPLLWLANQRAREGGLEAGAIITTGSYAGLHYAARGARARVEFTGLGTVLLEVG